MVVGVTIDLTRLIKVAEEVSILLRSWLQDFCDAVCNRSGQLRKFALFLFVATRTFSTQLGVGQRALMWRRSMNFESLARLSMPTGVGYYNDCRLPKK
jgi:hypothetical protein